jgi:riboflavin kinase / FMN adenylyltransferase
LKIFNSIDEFRCTKKTILTLGTFDGVHLGHRKILEKLKHYASSDSSEEQYESLVLTFYPHPRTVLQGEFELKALNSITEKIDLLASIGIQNLVIHPFDTIFSQLTAEEFVKSVLVDQFHIQKIIIGHDHRFGKNRTADIDDLIKFGKQYHFEVEQISVQEIQDVSISSTKIRTALTEGNITLANEYLGYEYFLTGIVTKGKQLGRTIGIPTANLQIEENDKLIPSNGVYVVKSIVNDQEIFGMMNIGFNPTVAGNKLSIEVHYFDFDGDLYDQEIRVSILKHLRSEQKFASVAILKAQLEKDKKSSFSFINTL